MNQPSRHEDGWHGVPEEPEERDEGADDDRRQMDEELER
jgi:hypothetical protein